MELRLDASSLLLCSLIHVTLGQSLEALLSGFSGFGGGNDMYRGFGGGAASSSSGSIAFASAASSSTSGSCPYQPHPDRLKFTQRVNGQTFIRTCAPGTMYDAQTCGCVNMPKGQTGGGNPRFGAPAISMQGLQGQGGDLSMLTGMLNQLQGLAIRPPSPPRTNSMRRPTPPVRAPTPAVRSPNPAPARPPTIKPQSRSSTNHMDLIRQMAQGNPPGGLPLDTANFDPDLQSAAMLYSPKTASITLPHGDPTNSIPLYKKVPKLADPKTDPLEKLLQELSKPRAPPQTTIEPTTMKPSRDISKSLGISSVPIHSMPDGTPQQSGGSSQSHDVMMPGVLHDKQPQRQDTARPGAIYGNDSKQHGASMVDAMKNGIQQQVFGTSQLDALLGGAQQQSHGISQLDALLGGAQHQQHGTSQLEALLRGAQQQQHGSSELDALLRGAQQQQTGASQLDALLRGAHQQQPDVSQLDALLRGAQQQQHGTSQLDALLGGAQQQSHGGSFFDELFGGTQQQSFGTPQLGAFNGMQQQTPGTSLQGALSSLQGQNSGGLAALLGGGVMGGGGALGGGGAGGGADIASLMASLGGGGGGGSGIQSLLSGQSPGLRGASSFMAETPGTPDMTSLFNLQGRMQGPAGLAGLSGINMVRLQELDRKGVIDLSDLSPAGAAAASRHFAG